MITIKRINYLKIVVIAMLILGFGIGTADACWRFISNQELVEEADLIVIGKIINYKEKKVSSEVVTEYWITDWDVIVLDVIKGERQLEKITVSTPGARNKSMIVSTDYRLDQNGKEVLLFLTKQDETYVPPSPQGVISVKQANLESEKLFERYEVSDTELIAELEAYIAENGVAFTFEDRNKRLLIPIKVSIALVVILIVSMAVVSYR